VTKRWWSRSDGSADGGPSSHAGGPGSWDSTRCPTCGRAHPLRTDTSFEWFDDDDLEQIELEATRPPESSGRPELDDVVVSDTTADLNQTPRWLPAALVLAAVAGLAALLVFSSGSATEGPRAEDFASDLADAATPEVEPTPVPTVDPAEAAAAEQETQRQRHEVASIWARTLVPAAASAKVVYRTEDSVALVDLGAGEQSELRLDVPIDLATDGFAYLASDRGTWVINPESLDAALRLAPQAEIGPLADPTSSIVMPEPNARFIMLSQHDGRIVRPIVEVPPASEVRIVGGRGAIVSPPTGGSSLVTSIGAEPLTNGRVIAANADYLVELRCEPLTCGAVVRPWPPLRSFGADIDPDAKVATEIDESLVVQLPADIWTATVLALSPTGEWLFVADDDGENWQLYDLRSGVAEAAGSGTDPKPEPATAVVWAPDGSYFAFLDQEGLVVGSPEMPTALAKVPLQFPPVPDVIASEMMVLPG